MIGIRDRRGAGLLCELVLVALVLAGCVWTVDRFLVDSRLPQPFIFDPNDTFMDWFNTAFWAHNPGAFDVWRTIYPPLSFVFLKVFGISACYGSDSFAARDCDWIGRSAAVAFWALGGILAYAAFRKEKLRTAPHRAIAFLFGLPWLFTLERGNLILPCFCAFVLAHSELVRARWIRALAASITINFKPYLVLPVISWAVTRQWRALELAGLATVVVYLITYAILGDGSPAQIASNTANWIQFVGAQVWEGIYYASSYAPMLAFDSYRFPARSLIPSKTFEAMMFAIPIVIRTSQLLGAACMIGALLQPRAVDRTRLSFVMLCTYLVTQSPGGYTVSFLVFLVFLEPWKRHGQIVAIVAAYLLCVPYDYVFANIISLSGNSWLAGRPVSADFGVSLGIFLRPALVVIMLWGLGLDTLFQVASAHWRYRPTLDLRPAAVSGEKD